MKTLTITEAKKNLGKWLNAAVRGEEVGIISGATILALHPVEVHARPWWETMPIDVEYLRTEYGVTPEEAEAAFARLDTRCERDLRKGGGGIIIEEPTQANLEKAISDYTRAHPPARTAAKKRAHRRNARAA